MQTKIGAAPVDPVWEKLYKEMKKDYYEMERICDIASKANIAYSEASRNMALATSKFEASTKACLEYPRY